MIATFIRLENSLDAAMSVNESPQTSFFEYRGVQLVTSSPYSYTQRTYASEGIELEEFVIEFFDICGNLIPSDGIDADTFKKIRTFQDPDTGLPQIEWSLKPTGLDFGNQLVYFRLTSGANGYIYSTPFVISDSGSEFVSEWWYKKKEADNWLSIGLLIYFRNRKSEQELSNYDPVSTGNQITGTSRITPFERFLTPVVNMDIIELFKTIFLNRFVYSKPVNFSGLPVKTGLRQGVESIDPEGDENFASYEVLLSRNYKLEFDPNAPVIVPPSPPVNPPSITLSSVVSVDANNVQYNFTLTNLPTSYLTYQYSLDGVTWISNTNGSVSPQQVQVPNNLSNAYYYRIYHPMATSNVVQIPVKAITITNIIKPNPLKPDLFRIAFNINYSPTNQLVFERSGDGVVFTQALYSSGNLRPKDVIDNSVLTDHYFRIRDTFYGVTSNIMQYE